MASNAFLFLGICLAIFAMISSKVVAETCATSEEYSDVTKNREGAGHCTSSKEHESLFQDQVEPCPLSSAIFYGGQEDMYIKSSDDRKTISYPSYKKEGREYDAGGNNQHDASRGNWWQGSLYY